MRAIEEPSAPSLPPPDAAEVAPGPGAVHIGVPAEALRSFTRFVGLDVHKRTVEGCVLDAAGRKLHREEFACTPGELARFAGRWGGACVAAALEATSNTWAVCNILAPLFGKVKVSNPLKTKAIAQASVKTDKVDATVLAQLLRCDYLPGVWSVDEQTRRLRQQVARRTALVQDRTAIRNRIHSALAAELAAPPMARLYSGDGLEWLRKIQLNEQTRRFIDSDLRLLESLEEEIAKLDKELAAAARQREQAKLLMTLPGVDYPTALTLLSALGDISRFADGDHAASYLGLTPSTKQSADHCYHGPITKQGNSHARWMLVEAAQHLDKHTGPLGVFFRRLAKKKNHNVAVAATARKMVTIAYLMLKNNEPYRYAQPQVVAAKLSRLRVRAGGAKRRTGPAPGSGRPAGYGTGKRTCRIPSLPEACQGEGLPAPRRPSSSRRASGGCWRRPARWRRSERCTVPPRAARRAATNGPAPLQP